MLQNLSLIFSENDVRGFDTVGSGELFSSATPSRRNKFFRSVPSARAVSASRTGDDWVPSVADRDW